MQIKELLGKTVYQEIDDIFYECFIAQADDEIGITIKVFDSDTCPKWMPREKDGSINVLCIDTYYYFHARKLPIVIEWLKDNDILTLEIYDALNDIAGTPPIASRFTTILQCAFQ